MYGKIYETLLKDFERDLKERRDSMFRDGNNILKMSILPTLI